MDTAKKTIFNDVDTFAESAARVPHAFLDRIKTVEVLIRLHRSADSPQGKRLLSRARGHIIASMDTDPAVQELPAQEVR